MPIQIRSYSPRKLLASTGVLVFLFAGLTGCGGQPDAPTGSVQGTVTYKGLPLPQGQVQLFSEPGRPVSIASVSNQGAFQFPEPVPVGKYSVAILPPGEEIPAGAEPPGTRPSPPVIPPKYQSEVTSGLEASIEPGENALVLQIK